MSTPSRKYTDILLAKVESGDFIAEKIVRCFTVYCSERQVKEMMQSNELLDSCQKCGDMEALDENDLCEECQEEEEEN